MNTKAKGARAERRARAMLEVQGYTVVRAAASLGALDLVAFNREALRLVQVKCNRLPRPAERQALSRFDNLPPCSTKELWRFRDRKREPEIEIL